MATRADAMMETRKLAADMVLQNRYRILSLLNQGGMGRVYLAEDLRFRSRVAVKEAYLTKEEFCRKISKQFANGEIGRTEKDAC